MTTLPQGSRAKADRPMDRHKDGQTNIQEYKTGGTDTEGQTNRQDNRQRDTRHTDDDHFAARALAPRQQIAVVLVGADKDDRRCAVPGPVETQH